MSLGVWVQPYHGLGGLCVCGASNCRDAGEWMSMPATGVGPWVAGTYVSTVPGTGVSVGVQVRVWATAKIKPGEPGSRWGGLGASGALRMRPQGVRGGYWGPGESKMAVYVCVCACVCARVCVCAGICASSSTRALTSGVCPSSCHKLGSLGSRGSYWAHWCMNPAVRHPHCIYAHTHIPTSRSPSCWAREGSRVRPLLYVLSVFMWVLCVCLSVLICAAQSMYTCIYDADVFVHMPDVPREFVLSLTIPAGPGGMELWQLCLSWDARFSFVPLTAMYWPDICFPFT